MSIHGDFNFKDVTIYLVGGAVRDMYIGVEPRDKDYVVVGSSPEEMESLGFILVGNDFPVYLHPKTGNEYALARTEISTGDGCTDFTSEWKGVTIEEDLARRDLTVNAMAIDCSRNLGVLIDPFNGRDDVIDKVLRHTSGAFVEDPLRVFRIARFLARFGNEWCVHHETEEMCSSMIDGGMLFSVNKQRVWIEFRKALCEKHPSLFFSWLYDMGHDVGMIERMIDCPQREDHHPEGNVWNHTAMVMDCAAKLWNGPNIVFACLVHDFGKPDCWDENQNAHNHELVGVNRIIDFCDVYRVPTQYKILALDACKLHTKIHGVFGRDNENWTRPKSIMKMFESVNALSAPQRFINILSVCESDAKGRGFGGEQILEYSRKPYKQKEYLMECLYAAVNKKTNHISQRMLNNGMDGVKIGQAIREARIEAIREVQKQKRWMKNNKNDLGVLS